MTLIGVKRSTQRKPHSSLTFPPRIAHGLAHECILVSAVNRSNHGTTEVYWILGSSRGGQYFVMFLCRLYNWKSRDASAHSLAYWPATRESCFDFRQDKKLKSLLQSVHARPWAHQDSCQVGTRGFIHGGQAAGSWSWPLTALYVHCLLLKKHWNSNAPSFISTFARILFSTA
jgi:hypothetical protein